MICCAGLVGKNTTLKAKYPRRDLQLSDNGS
jgi:hypothetical protein